MKALPSRVYLIGALYCERTALYLRHQRHERKRLRQDGVSVLFFGDVIQQRAPSALKPHERRPTHIQVAQLRHGGREGVQRRGT